MSQKPINKKIQDDKISSDIKRYIKNHFNEVTNMFNVGVYEYTTRMDHSRKKYRFHEIEKRNLKTLFEKVFEEKGHELLYDILGIEPIYGKVEIDYNDMPLVGDADEIHCTSLEKVKGMKFISSVEQERVEVILLSTGENVSKECGVDTDIISVDYFACNIVYNLKMSICENIEPWEIMDNTDSYILCKVYGVKCGTDYPMWIEYILMSYVFYNLNNEKMAFFTAFAALDQFIEIVYDRLPILYRQVYYDNMKNISDSDGKILEDKRNIYMNLNRRLIDEKLHDILKERFEVDTEYLSYYNQIQKYEKDRNKIAHCQVVDIDGKYIDLLKNILNIIYLVGYGKDVTSIFKEKA